MAGLLAYGAVVLLSPKTKARPQPRRISAAPSWPGGKKPNASAGQPAAISAWMIRQGVQGSSRPGFRITGVLSGIAGSQREFTPGELLGITRPRHCAAA